MSLCFDVDLGKEERSPRQSHGTYRFAFATSHLFGLTEIMSNRIAEFFLDITIR